MEERGVYPKGSTPFVFKEVMWMYSPKIDQRLIPDLYRAARARRIPMTKLVAQWLREALGAEQLPHKDLYVLEAPAGAEPMAVVREKSGTDQEYETKTEKQTKGVMQ